MATDHRPPSETESGQTRLMLEQLRDDMRLMHEGMDLRFDALEAKMDAGFAEVRGRLSTLERIVQEHGRKIDALHGMILDNREAIEANRREIEANRREIEANRREIEANRREILDVRAKLEKIDERLRTRLEPRLDAVEARIDANEQRLDALESK